MHLSDSVTTFGRARHHPHKQQFKLNLLNIIYRVCRSRELVEAKLTTSLGEAVYGEPLPPNIIAQPTTSFDQDGYFIGIVKPPAAPTSGECVSL